MSEGQLALVVCVSADRGVRERLMRRLGDLGTLILCSDLAELRAMLLTTEPAAPPDAAQPSSSFAPATLPPSADAAALPAAPSPAALPPPAYAARPPSAQVALPPSPYGAPPAPVDPPVCVGDLAVDPDGYLVSWRGTPLPLSRLERDVLTRLASPPVRVWTYEKLFASVWGGAYLGDTAILHSAVKRLRRRLRAVDGGPRIQTLRGVGYRLALGD